MALDYTEREIDRCKNPIHEEGCIFREDTSFVFQVIGIGGRSNEPAKARKENARRQNTIKFQEYLLQTC